MTRSLSGDLRGRVIAAIEDGISTREAARRFRIGIAPDVTLAEIGERLATERGVQAAPLTVANRVREAQRPRSRSLSSRRPHAHRRSSDQ